MRALRNTPQPLITRQILVALLSIELYAIPTLAYEPERARENLSYDLVQCATYYQMSAISAEKMSGADAAKDLLKSKDLSLKMLAAFRPERGATQKLQADFELATKEFARTVNEEGWSRITLLYADMCRDLLKDPEPRLNYWLQKQD